MKSWNSLPCSLILLALVTGEGCRSNDAIVIPDAEKTYTNTQDANPVEPMPTSNNGTVPAPVPVVPAPSPEVLPGNPAPAPQPIPAPVPLPTPSPLPAPIPAPMPAPVPMPVPTPTPKAVQTVPNGNYKLKGIASGRCLDDPNSNPSIGVQVQIWDCVSSAAQNLTITHTADDYYKITNAFGKVLEVRDGSFYQGGVLQTGDYSGKNYQQFKFIKKSDGSYSIQVKGSDYYVDVVGDLAAAGTKIGIWTVTPNKNQLWALVVLEIFK